MLSKRLLLVALSLLLLMCIQTIFRPLKTVQLSGYENVPESEQFSLFALANHQWQSNQEEITKKTFGFRAHFVRLYNQAIYTLFDEYHFEVIKKGDTLYEFGYLPTMKGEDFLGEEQIQLKMDSLNAFRTWLAAQNKKLLIVFAPNKWRSYSAIEPYGGLTNYSVFKEKLEAEGFEIIDYIQYFEQHAATSEYPLHSKQGTHWSIYGAFVSGNLLHNKLGEMGFQIPQLELDSIEVSSPRNTDRDLHALLNIMTPPNAEELAYPHLSFKTESEVNALIVGDSYYLTYYYLGLHQGLFSGKSKFFYYNQQFMNQSEKEKFPLTDSIRSIALQQADLVILEMSEPSLKWFGYTIFEMIPDK